MCIDSPCVFLNFLLQVTHVSSVEGGAPEVDIGTVRGSAPGRVSAVNNPGVISHSDWWAPLLPGGIDVSVPVIGCLKLHLFECSPPNLPHSGQNASEIRKQDA